MHIYIYVNLYILVVCTYGTMWLMDGEAVQSTDHLKICMHVQLDPGSNLVNVRIQGKGGGGGGDSKAAGHEGIDFTSLNKLSSDIICTKLRKTTHVI